MSVRNRVWRYPQASYCDGVISVLLGRETS
ncbi:MAG: hypothetical protein QOH54_1235, partial [Mycobacterium sp.]|nr:hypothetical protein [Mycobacterium sp.]